MLSDRTRRFVGAYTTLLTPFDASGALDEEALRRLVDFQIDNGVTRLCPNGVTGEAAALTDEEKLRITRICVEQAAGRALVIPDIGTENLIRTLELAKEAERLGADAVLSFTPYLDPPTERGMVAYFQKVADAVSVPLLMHNLPGRTTVDLSPAQAAELAAHPNIIGMKEGNQDIVRLRRVLHVVRDADFVVLAGNDFTALPALLLGGHGHISVAANVMPRQSRSIVEAALAGDFVTARDLYLKYAEFYRGIYFATNPIALKEAFALAHFPVGGPRLPLTPMPSERVGELETIMKECGLL
ncbi:4-hydroxy-tetrahydrodipicolinate synthase [Kitasatospora phosalacinea]|uniref:4-hydroxy-tetrahydrodipicolinate synthase n=1 Tax=Kitasatospora phosalacinea TaxID=2065 RepID=A0A9W6V0F3_9ACTN|nr:4-hydroxy-tetrahydrodipicolinate synthase [Kitasatospora phosalacinea]GLW70774.1 4-hydroxy-tetrahydrodipicolinate synthase [Kitasatospora phosalacinea]